MLKRSPPSIPVTLWWWLLCGYLYIKANAQSENAIGAHRAYEKTSFSCAGRPAGYYADIETGCQVYHMCDGLGRQFSYSCPNTTLFQQRMLICDHWYMVNCSKAESHYKANLLIGQRDKPFVNDEENNFRTPRPDLLDRPYAPDYSGESFRHQYKQLPASQNRISDRESAKNSDKVGQASQSTYGQQRWKIPPPSRTIQPPAYEPQVEPQDEYKGTATTSQSRFGTRATTQRPAASTTTASYHRRVAAGFTNAPLHQRPRNSPAVTDEDLGTSHSTRYNTSSDFNSAEAAAVKPIRRPTTVFTTTTTRTTTTTTTTTTRSPPVKVPSKIYEPPFLYPIYNENDTISQHTSTARPLRVSTATPFKRPASTTPPRTSTAYTTRAPSRPTTFAGKPFAASQYTTTSTASPSSGKLGQASFNRFDFAKFEKDGRTPTPAQGFKPPTPLPPVNTAPKTNKSPVGASALDYQKPTGTRLELPPKPANDLLPPFQEFVEHDVATTQGPPIYYEWKIPSNGLEPPKLDPPIGVDGREYPEAVPDYNSINSAGAGGFAQSQSFGIDQGRSPFAPGAFSNPFFKSTLAPSTTTTRTPASRSIKETAQPNSVQGAATSKRSQAASGLEAAAVVLNTDISELRKELSVPEYSFPLENIGRTGYLDTNTYNSFQLKIPERRADAQEKQHWFGENPKCPECHPSYVVPGTCTPCLRR